MMLARAKKKAPKQTLRRPPTKTELASLNHWAACVAFAARCARIAKRCLVPGARPKQTVAELTEIIKSVESAARRDTSRRNLVDKAHAIWNTSPNDPLASAVLAAARCAATNTPKDAAGHAASAANMAQLAGKSDEQTVLGVLWDDMESLRQCDLALTQGVAKSNFTPLSKVLPIRRVAKSIRRSQRSDRSAADTEVTGATHVERRLAQHIEECLDQIQAVYDQMRRAKDIGPIDEDDQVLIAKNVVKARRFLSKVDDILFRVGHTAQDPRNQPAEQSARADSDADVVISALNTLESELEKSSVPRLIHFQAALDELARTGRRGFGSFTLNDEIARRVTDLAASHGMRLIYAGQPVSIDCARADLCVTGIFRVRKIAERQREIYGRTSWPKLTVASRAKKPV